MSSPSNPMIQKYGGGNFVLLFVLFMILLGVPLLLAEFILGQRYQKGVIQVWIDMHPSLVGIGFAAATIAFLIASYYLVINVWGFYYLFNSIASIFMSGNLPWAECPINATSLSPISECVNSSPTEYFFYRNAMGISDSINNFGDFQIPILLNFILAWVLVFLFVNKGIESSGKVMYVTATFPFLVLTIFLIRGLTLEGSSNGLKYLIDIDVSQLADFNLWIDAAAQVFYSIGIGAGGVIAFASYCPMHQNCMRDSITIGILNIVTALYIAVTIFSIMGFRATFQYNSCLDYNIELISDQYDLATDYITHENYDELVGLYPTDNLNECDLDKFLKDGVGGSGLAFIVITEGINNMPAPAIMSCLFFIMLLLLGIGSMFGAVQSYITPIFDYVEKVGYKIRLEVIASLGCLAAALVGIIFTFNSGYYWVNLFNDFSVGIPLMTVGWIELFICTWFFGLDNWMGNLTFMLGPPTQTYDKFLFKFYKLMFGYVTPLVLTIVLGFSLYNLIAMDYVYAVWDRITGSEIKELYPSWAIVFIICLQFVSLGQIPLFAGLYQCSKQRFLKMTTDLRKPYLDWSKSGQHIHDI